ncbi:tumor protein D53 isoform X2 [Gadus morhua]|uniref:tumor protein D53 isoform X2 n=1 Tax=Gadus morhua TaxID=8049 RepID=UPI0011B40DC0|nr:tumor protein D53 isoform X2 [Gadus morhua]
METRQQELYSSVLSDAVVDWGSESPGEEWVNTNREGAEHGPRDEDLAHLSEDSHVVGRSLGDSQAVGSQNGEAGLGDGAAWHGGSWGAPTTTGGREEWGRPSLRLSEDWPMTGPWNSNAPDRGNFRTGLLDSEPLREADEDLASEGNYPILTEEEREEIHQELDKLEEEISTLRQVLTSKEKQQADLRQKLGISPLSDFKNNVSKGWHDMQTSVAYKKTTETFSTAGQKTSAAFSTLGTAITRKLGDMSYSIRHSMSMPTMRNSPSFKSFEEKVESTVTTIKTKVGGPEPGGSFEEVLSSAAQASSQERPSPPLTDSSERPC